MTNKIIITLLLITIFNPVKAQQDWQNLDYIHKAFNEIAFKNEYKTTNNKVLKWQVPINYDINFFKIKPSYLATELTQTHLKQLMQITKHPIKTNNNNKPHNFSIIFTQDKNYKLAINKFSFAKENNIEQKSNCMGQFITNRKSEILKAIVIIPIDRAMGKGLLVACIVEEITQVMGLPNDSYWVNPSIANDQSKIEFLTGLDYIMLKTLYDPHLKAGMTQAQSKPIIQNILKQLQTTNTIKKAQYLVNKTGLYNYSN